MTKRKLKALLDDAEGEVNRVDLPADVDRRLRSRLFGQPQGRRWGWVMSAACAAALALALAWPRQAAPQQLDGFVITARSADLKAEVTAEGTIEIELGACTLADAAAGEELAITAPALLRREGNAVRVLSGTVVVSVQKRNAASPTARVLVSHGVIEVVGTRFTIVQGADRGAVTLHEGEIRFVDLGAGSRALAPGQRLEWPPAPAAPLPKIEAPALAPLPPVVSKATRPVSPRPLPVEAIRYRDPEDLLQQVDVLRSRGLFAEAVRYLSHGLDTELRPATRERFSYELGSILTYRLSDSRAACAHWADHARRYPAGRYQAEVRQASAHLTCEGVTP